MCMGAPIFPNMDEEGRTPVKVDAEAALSPYDVATRRLRMKRDMVTALSLFIALEAVVW